MQYKDLKKYIYKLDPETAHTLIEKSLHFIGERAPFFLKPLAKQFQYSDKALSQSLLGMMFPNPVGIAAGFDKDATMLPALEAMGFGFIEFGTVTPLPQNGNEKPRLFRYPEFNSIQNAMGFNNKGLVYVRKKVTKIYPFKVPIVANIGKNKLTADEDTLQDYEQLIDGFKDVCDFLVINISSPNTPGLRTFQNKKFIQSLFTMATYKTSKPVFLKISPDLEIADALEICSVAIEYGASGIIATNTTTDYTLLPNARNFGGISGEVLREKSFIFFEALAKEFFSKTILISVGGISDAKEAYRRLKAGASLVQVYSALIFEGPYVTKKINQGLVELMHKEGYSHISEIIGLHRKQRRTHVINHAHSTLRNAHR